MNKEQFEEVLEKVKAGENTSGLDPVEYRVVVLNDYVETTTSGGLIEKPQAVIESDKWAQTRGYVVVVSDMAFTGESGKAWPCSRPKPGDKILFAKYAGQLTEVDGITYRLVSDKDVLAVIK